jgi:hypothetical protein
MDIYAVALSVGLQHRVPLAELLVAALDLYCVPNGATDDPQIPRVRSVIDYVGRRLAIDWLPHRERARLGILLPSAAAAAWSVSAAAQAASAARSGSVAVSWRICSAAVAAVLVACSQIAARSAAVKLAAGMPWAGAQRCRSLAGSGRGRACHR